MRPFRSAYDSAVINLGTSGSGPTPITEQVVVHGGQGSEHPGHPLLGDLRYDIPPRHGTRIDRCTFVGLRQCHLPSRLGAG